MEIGIVTIYDAFNYGSYLQAYAMQKVLESLGHQVTILNCTRQRFKLIKRLATRNVANFFLKLQRYYVYSKAWRELKIQKNVKQRFDIIIIGSDEVWNIKNPSFEHWPEYFGYNLNCSKIIAYAPSCGYATLDQLLADNISIKGIKNNIDLILPRDKATKTLIKTIKGVECKEVVDPTILYLDKWEREASELKIQDEYLLYYSYNDKPLMLNYLNQYAKENNLKLIVAGFKYDWCDQSLIVEPKQFLAIVKNAKYIATTTFHGSIFSVIFKKRFIGFYPNRNQKVHDFLESVGLEKRVYIAGMSYDTFKKVLEEQINYTEIHEKLKCKANKSIEYLKHALNVSVK